MRDTYTSENVSVHENTDVAAHRDVLLAVNRSESVFNSLQDFRLSDPGDHIAARIAELLHDRLRHFPVPLFDVLSGIEQLFVSRAD